MNRLTPFCLAFLTCALLAACGGNSTTQSSSANGHSATPENSPDTQTDGNTKVPPHSNNGPGSNDTTTPKPTPCNDSNDCSAQSICKNNQCIDLSGSVDLCKTKALTCSKGFRCENNSCVPDCDDPCNGVCCGDDQVCFNNASCEAACSDGRKLCNVGGAPTCCKEGTACLGNACVPLGSTCDDQTTFCPIVQYCELSEKSCVRYDANPSLCLFDIPEVFEPEVRLHWNGSPSAPLSNEIMVTPVVAKLNDDEIPDIVFTSYQGAHNYFSPGIMHVISGKAGATPQDITYLWESTKLTTNPFWANPLITPALGKLTDGGPLAIVLAAKTANNKNYIRAVDGKTGALIWKNEDIGLGSSYWGTAIAIANLDRTGPAEIIFGKYVLDGATGNLLCELGGNNWMPIAVDLDGDSSNMEIVAGLRTYSFTRNGSKATCKLRPTEESNPSVFPSELGDRALSAVADIDPDVSGPEIATVHNNTLYLADSRGKILRQVAIPGFNNGGPPTLADFDGDGKLEIGVATSEAYAVYNHDLSLLWKHTVQESSSGVTGSAVFDFDGDGKAEVVYNDEVYLRVFSGEKNPTKRVRFETKNTSGTATENPIIVDVDNDGHADIIIGANTYGTSPTTGLFVFSDKNNRWVNTRQIWNQHTYHITNVEDDGTIPQHEPHYWKEEWSNNFRQNVQKGNSRFAPNLTVKINKLYNTDCLSDSTTRPIVYTISNVGDADVPQGALTTKVMIAEAGTSTFEELDTRVNTKKIVKGGSERVEFEANIPPKFHNKLVDIKVVVDPDNKVPECNLLDNEDIVKGISTSAPNLIPTIVSISGGSCSNQTIPYTFEVHNRGGADVPKNNFKIKVYAGLKGQLKLIKEITDVPEIKKGTFVSFSETWSIDPDFFNKPLDMRIVVDEENNLNECVETDNEVESAQSFLCYDLQ